MSGDSKRPGQRRWCRKEERDGWIEMPNSKILKLVIISFYSTPKQVRTLERCWIGPRIFERIGEVTFTLETLSGETVEKAMDGFHLRPYKMLPTRSDPVSDPTTFDEET